MNPHRPLHETTEKRHDKKEIDKNIKAYQYWKKFEELQEEKDDEEETWIKRPPVTSTKEQREKNREHRTKLRKSIINRLGGKCVCCGIDKWWVLTIDHIIPTLNAKRNSQAWQKLYHCEDLSEYQCLCFGCNASKNDRKECELNHFVEGEE